MKQTFTLLTLFGLLAASPGFGQNGSVKLKASYAYTYFKPETGETVNDDSTHYTYNNDHQIIEQIEWRILPSAVDWTLFDRTHAITYDGAGLRLTAERQSWTGTIWYNYARYAYVYDAEGRKMEEIRDAWSGGNWVSDNVTKWEYDSLGHLLSETSPQSEILYTYNADGYISTVTINQEFNGGGTFRYRLLNDYLPLSGGLPFSETWQNWNMNAWENNYKVIYDYNTAGSILNSTNQSWTGALWSDVKKTANTYNIDEKLTYTIAKTLVNGIWMNESQDTYKYDVDGDLIYLNSDKWYNNEWSKFLRVRYHYEIIAAQHTPTDSGFSFFPNPASATLTLTSDGSSLANIFDQQGRLVRSKSLHGLVHETIQLGELPAGNYLLQVLGNDGKMGAKPLQIRH